MSELDMPRTLGRYRLDGVVGQGAMGVVYKAYDPVIDRVLAIKVVRADLLDGAAREEYLSRFRREAQAAGKCMHPNIVAVYDYSEDRDCSFIAMEYIQGRALQDFLREGVRLEPKETLFILLQVLSGLGAAHGLGIVHRDIKPANVILLEGGQIKVTDFGVARLGSAGLTQHGSIIGTPSYMSPEQCKGEEVDGRTDLFSTGVILYELLAGEKPFPGQHATEVMYKLLNHEPREIGELNPAAPPGIGGVIRRALAKRPEDRYQSAQEFADGLRAAFSDTTAGSGEAGSDHTVVIPSQPTAASGTATFAQRWENGLLRSIEEDLAYYVGPVAKVLVRNAAEKTQSVAELYDTLSRKIPSEADRSQFLRKGLRDRDATGAAGSSTGAAEGGLAPAALEAAQAALTHHIGPIAKVLVRKAAGQAKSLDDLYERLSAHITREGDRAAFLRSRPRS